MSKSKETEVKTEHSCTIKIKSSSNFYNP